MADITDPAAIRFVNEQIRPLCEEGRALAARITAAQTAWYAGLNATIGTGTGIIQDGRTAEGVSRLTADDVTNAISNLFAILTASNSQILSKPCVRAIQVS